MAKAYLYKNIKVEPYSNGYRPYYVHADGSRELLAVLCLSSKIAWLVGRMEVNYMNIEDLGKRISEFVWTYDTYEMWDTYGQNGFDKCVKDTIDGLENPDFRKGIIEYLQNIVDYDDDKEVVTKAKKLLKEIR